MNLIKVKCILKACEVLNITKAAQELYISQQALSKTIQSVERDLSITLFFRTAQGLTLTESGQHFYEIFSPLVKQFDAAIEEFRTNASGKIRLGLSGGVLRRIGVTILDDFRRAYPHIELSVTKDEDGNNVEHVLNGSCDIALCPSPLGENKNKLHFVEIWQEPIYIVINKAHPLAHKAAVYIEDMKGMPILRSSAKDWTYQAIFCACQAAGFQPNFVNSFEEIDLMKETAVQTNSIFVCPQLYTKYLPPDSKLVPIIDPILVVKEGFLYRKDVQLAPQTLKLISFVSKNISLSHPPKE